MRGRLALLVAALLLPVLALAGAMIWQGYRNERDSVGTTLLSTARAVSRVVDTEVEKADLLLRAISSSVALANDDLETVAAMARSAIGADERWFVVVDPSGQQLVNSRGAPLRVVEYERNFIPTMRRGELYVSQLRRSRATGLLVVHVSRPYFRDGELKYILSVTITPDSFASALHITRFAPGKIVTVLDKRGVVVARNRHPDRFVGKSASTDMAEAITNRREGVLDSVTLDGIPVLTAFARGEHGWNTIIAAPKADLYTSARRLLLWGLCGASLLILVAVLMALWIGRAVVFGVDQLAHQATALKTGADSEPGNTGLDETDFVADAMSRAGQSLRHRTRTLEALNAINTGIVMERDVEKILRTVTDAGRQLSNAEFGGFFFHRDEAGELRILTASGATTEQLDGFKSPPHLDLLHSIIEGRGPLRVDDLGADARNVTNTPFPSSLQSLRVRSLLGIPVASRNGNVIGGFFFGHSKPSAFMDEAVETLVGVASEAAIAVENAMLYRELARELEAKSKAEADLRVAQVKLSEHARELERKVDERTASLQEAVTQMEEFSYTVSHDLRSPLRAMQAFADALVEDYGPKLDATGHDYLQRIQRASRRMDQLTTDLLTYSRMVRSQLKLEPVDVEGLLHATLEHYPELQAKNADIQLHAPFDRVMAHDASLKQCLANLLTNAAKFTKPGEKARVEVRTEKLGERVRIWVEDHGIGIAPEYHAKLFRIFERGPNSIGYPGTGIGLAIVRKAAEKMGGSCGLISKANAGSRFWIELAAA